MLPRQISNILNALLKLKNNMRFEKSMSFDYQFLPFSILKHKLLFFILLPSCSKINNYTLHLIDWRADGYHWRQHGGKNNIKFNGKLCKKTPYYTLFKNEEGQIEETNKYMRYCYEHPDFPLRCLIVYKGDATLQNEYPHGNATTEHMLCTNFVQTKHSVREEMKQTIDSPMNAYRRLVGKGPESINEHEMGTPRNAKQVANFQAAERRRLC